MCPGCQKGQPYPGVRQAQHCRAREAVVPLCSAQPHLQHWVQVWVPLHKMDIKLFESLVAGNREGEGSEGTVGEEWLRPLGVLSPEQKS